MERSSAGVLFLLLFFCETVLSQPDIENNLSFTVYENEVIVKTIEEVVKRNSLEVMDALMKEMRRGFQDLKRELKEERSRREALEEKMDKCIAGVQHPMVNQQRTMDAKVITCPIGFSEFGNHCYLFKMELMEWDKARDACQYHNAYLVSVNTQEEQDYLVTQIDKSYLTGGWDYFWTGMTLSDGKKVWADGTDVYYTKWGDPDCMESAGCKVALAEYYYFSWENVDGSFKFNFICELEKASSEETTLPQSTPPSTTLGKVETITEGCPVGFSEFRNHCYMFKTKKLPWDMARDACQHHDANLVSVNSQEEQDYLVKQIRTDYLTIYYDNFWTGMTLVDGKKVWADGTDVNYTKWGEDNPDCMESAYCKVSLSEFYDFSWEDVGGWYIYNYICELEKASSEETTLSQSTPPSTTVEKVKTITEGCPVGFSEFKNHCYMFETNKLPWNLSSNACLYHNAYLVSVNTQEEQDYLITQIKTDYLTTYDDSFWTGMTLVDGKKVWADGTDVNYTKWSQDSPDCVESADCKVSLSEFYDFSWEDVGGWYKYNYICELEKAVL